MRTSGPHPGCSPGTDGIGFSLHLPPLRGKLGGLNLDGLPPSGIVAPAMPPSPEVGRVSTPAGIRHPADMFINFRSMPPPLPSRRKPRAGTGVSLDVGIARHVAAEPAAESSSAHFRSFPGGHARADADESPSRHGGSRQTPAKAPCSMRPWSPAQAHNLARR